MINQPQTDDLLTEARRVLIESLVPELSGGQKYQALMVANAMGMAVRELEQRDKGEPEATDRALEAFLTACEIPRESDLPEGDLARAIRQRKLGGSSEELRSMLRRITEARLRINKPGYLK